MTIDLLRESFKALKPKAAPGVDGTCAQGSAKRRVGARLSHPNLAQIFDYGTHAQDVERGEVQPFLVMPLLHGRTLRELASDGPLPWPRAVRMIRQLLAGLGALHAAGVLHRDVKLDNCILVREHGGEVLKVIVVSERSSLASADR